MSFEFKKMIYSVIGGVAVLAAAQFAAAFGQEGKPYISLNAGYGATKVRTTLTSPVASSANFSNNKYAFGGAIGTFASEEVSAEVAFIYLPSKSTGKKSASDSPKTNVKNMGVFLVGNYHLVNNNPITPIVRLGFGAIKSQYKVDAGYIATVAGQNGAVRKTNKTGLAGLVGVRVSYKQPQFDMYAGYDAMFRLTKKGNRANLKSDVIEGQVKGDRMIHYPHIGVTFTF